MERNEFEHLAENVRGHILTMVERLAPAQAPEFAEDVAQDTLLKLWTLRQRLDEYASPQALAMTIARRRAIDLLRERGQTVALDSVAEPEAERAVADASEAAAADERLGALMQAVESLPPGQQLVVRMRHFDLLEIDEIARLTGQSPGAVRTSLSRARGAMRRYFLSRE